MILEKEKWKAGLQVVVVNTEDPSLAELTTIGTKGVVTTVHLGALDEFYHHYQHNNNEYAKHTPIRVEAEDVIFWASPIELSLLINNNVEPLNIPDII